MNYGEQLCARVLFPFFCCRLGLAGEGYLKSVRFLSSDEKGKGNVECVYSEEFQTICLACFGLFYELEGLSDAGVGGFTIRASYQTFVLNLSIDKRPRSMRN